MCIGLVSSELQSSGTPLALPTHRSIRAGRMKGTYYSLFLFRAINYKKAGVVPCEGFWLFQQICF